MDSIKIVTEQRKSVIIVATILAIAATGTNLLGLSGHQGSTFLIINLIYLSGVILGMFFALLKKGIPLLPVIICLLVASELIVCLESIICAYENTPYSILLIIGDMTILSFVLLMSLLSYLRYTTYVLSSITIITYTACAYITKNEDLWGLYAIFVLLFSVGSILSSMLTKGVNKIFKEHVKFKADMSDFLSAMGLSEADFAAYIELTKESKVGDRKALGILNLMGNSARETLKRNIVYLMEQDKIVYDKISEVIPEFTPSEVEMAKLIIEGKKMHEMALILNKKESYISHHRITMRGKLNLKEKENLKKAIIKQVILK